MAAVRFVLLVLGVTVGVQGAATLHFNQSDHLLDFEDGMLVNGSTPWKDHSKGDFVLKGDYDVMVSSRDHHSLESALAFIETEHGHRMQGIKQWWKKTRAKIHMAYKAFLPQAANMQKAEVDVQYLRLGFSIGLSFFSASAGLGVFVQVPLRHFVAVVSRYKELVKMSQEDEGKRPANQKYQAQQQSSANSVLMTKFQDFFKLCESKAKPIYRGIGIMGKFALKFSLLTMGVPIPGFSVGIALPMPGGAQALSACVGGPLVAMTSTMATKAKANMLASRKRGSAVGAKFWQGLYVGAASLNRVVTNTFCVVEMSLSAALGGFFEKQACPGVGVGFGASYGIDEEGDGVGFKFGVSCMPRQWTSRTSAVKECACVPRQVIPSIVKAFASQTRYVLTGKGGVGGAKGKQCSLRALAESDVFCRDTKVVKCDAQFKREQCGQVHGKCGRCLEGYAEPATQSRALAVAASVVGGKGASAASTSELHRYMATVSHTHHAAAARSQHQQRAPHRRRLQRQQGHVPQQGSLVEVAAGAPAGAGAAGGAELPACVKVHATAEQTSMVNVVAVAARVAKKAQESNTGVATSKPCVFQCMASSGALSRAKPCGDAPVSLRQCPPKMEMSDDPEHNVFTMERQTARQESERCCMNCDDVLGKCKARATRMCNAQHKQCKKKAKAVIQSGSCDFTCMGDGSDGTPSAVSLPLCPKGSKNCGDGGQRTQCVNGCNRGACFKDAKARCNMDKALTSYQCVFECRRAFKLRPSVDGQPCGYDTTLVKKVSAKEAKGVSPFDAKKACNSLREQARKACKALDPVCSKRPVVKLSEAELQGRRFCTKKLHFGFNPVAPTAGVGMGVSFAPVYTCARLLLRSIGGGYASL